MYAKLMLVQGARLTEALVTQWTRVRPIVRVCSHICLRIIPHWIISFRVLFSDRVITFILYSAVHWRIQGEGQSAPPPNGGSRGPIRSCFHWCSHRAFVSTSSETLKAFLYYLIIVIFGCFVSWWLVK